MRCSDDMHRGGLPKNYKAKGSEGSAEMDLYMNDLSPRAWQGYRIYDEEPVWSKLGSGHCMSMSMSVSVSVCH